MRTKLLFITFLLVFSNLFAKDSKTTHTTSTPKNDIEDSFSAYSTYLYNTINDNDLNFEAFKHGLRGYTKLHKQGKLDNNKYLTIIDMSASSNVERFFIINMETYQLEHKSLVAHGKNTGGEFAKQFSNTKNSYKTSIGFYKIAEQYTGKHGKSLRLDGLEFSNSNARKRAVVLHKANYVSSKFVKKNGRLGRSLGCPALPSKDYATIISKVKNGSCLFIYFPQKTYLNKSKLIS